MIHAWAAPACGAPLEAWAFEPGPLGPCEVEIAVEHCGICHSDLSVLHDDWGNAVFPCVPGHEVVGRVVSGGSLVNDLAPGQRVAVGWTAGSCDRCRCCIGGDQHLCSQAQPTIVGHHGGFAERVRADRTWVFPLPDGLDPAAAAPLLCGGITVFSPLLEYASPAMRVGVVGIGGLGHMALKFAAAFGCEVTAFTSTPAKAEEAGAFGASRVVSSRDAGAMRAIAGSLDLVIYTLNVSIDWAALMATLAPRGRLHIVGAVLDPVPLNLMPMLVQAQQVSASPTGSPAAIATMLDFAARHRIAPQVERFPMSRANEALEHLAAGRARYRVVLDADFPASQ
ncbi:MAG: NAD(P)-dependent alcohol dehydrogenase [Chromatiales bacterium]|nr:NAD(P)-dependent alcohol dehydrogenase [Chromatiales bacterium]